MNERCRSCFMQGRDIPDALVCSQWLRLAMNPKMAEVLAGPSLESFDIPQAVDSGEPATRKIVNGRRIAQCFLARIQTGDCPMAEQVMPAGVEAVT